ncbi:MAG: glycosyltransferase family 39 protein [Hyphomicrobium sp.]|nr:glycosyltransferase family 39 protein [Hyphomicrobium sp.]
MLALLALCLSVYLPGVVRLPAVDRTEVVFAETTRDMLARGALADPRFGTTVHQFRPIGSYWAQAKVAWLAGPQHARDITVYRLPGMLAVTLAVLAVYWLAAPLIGASAAFIAAALFAVAPLTVLVAHLAIAEGLSLLPATVAMLALLRIYTAPPDAPTRGLALLFWAALGLGVLINALLVPILVIVTLIALRLMDRDFWWLQRLHVWPGLPLALVIASPWLIVRVMQDGVPFAGLDVQEFLAALGGAQDMKLRAMPGTFVLALLLGFLPGTALFVPAFASLWRDRDAKIVRFLLAWVAGYIVYLELLSSKPGTYMVQTLFPAAAIAVAMLVVRENGKMPPPRFHALAWPPLAAAFALLLFAAPYVAVREPPDVWLWLPIAVVAGLFAWSAAEGRAGQLVRWAISGVAALGLFAVTLIAGVLPSIDVIWPAREIQRALADCPAERLGVLGFNEPTSIFVLNRDARLSSKDGLAALADSKEDGRAVIASGWSAANPGALTADQKAKLRPLACIRAINTMRGCALNLTVVGNNAAPACAPPPEYSCSEAFTLHSGASTLKACD